MHRTRNRLVSALLLFVLFSLIAVVAQCQDGIVVIGLATKINTLDPAFHKTSDSDGLDVAIYSKLVRYEMRTAENILEPDLAESWEISGDGLTYTFFLRKGIQFHSGRPLTAEDVARSFRRHMDPEVGSRWSGNVAGVEKVEALDDYTVQFTLEKRDVGFMDNVIAAIPGPSSIVNPEAIEMEPYSPNADGTGPYMLVSFDPASEIVLERNPKYYFHHSGPQRVIFRYLPNPSVRAMALRRNEIQFSYFLDVEAWRTLQGVDGINRQSVSADYIYCLHFNTKRNPLNILEVRQALAYATDKVAVYQAIVGDFGQAAYSAVAPNHLGYYPAWEIYSPLNLEKARFLLKEAGYPDGFEIDYTAIAGRADYEIPGEVLREQWAKIGVTLKLNTAESAVIGEWRSKFQYDTHWDGDLRKTGLQLLVPNLHSEFADGSHDYSAYGLAIPGVDAILDHLRGELDRDVREELMHEVQRLAAYDVALLPMWYKPALSAWTSAINIHFMPRGRDTLPLWLLEVAE